MIELLVALVAQSPETVTLDEVRAAEVAPMRLAPVLLGPETGGRIQGGSVRRQFIPGQVYRAVFWEQGAVESEGLCGRPAHAVDLRNTELPSDASAPDAALLTVGPLRSGRQYAVDRDGTCAQATGWFGVSDRNGAAELGSIARLTEAMRLAEGEAPLPFALSCEAEDAEACRDARAALAGLPLDVLLGVRMRNTVYRQEPSTDDGVNVRYMQPVENGRWPEAEVSFGETPPDRRSRTVVLKGIDRLEAVEMRRSTIIRH